MDPHGFHGHHGSFWEVLENFLKMENLRLIFLAPLASPCFLRTKENKGSKGKTYGCHHGHHGKPMDVTMVTMEKPWSP